MSIESGPSWNDASGSVAGQKQRQKEMTFQDVYGAELLDDEEEDDDSDWEPSETMSCCRKWKSSSGSAPTAPWLTLDVLVMTMMIFTVIYMESIKIPESYSGGAMHLHFQRMRMGMFQRRIESYWNLAKAFTYLMALCPITEEALRACLASLGRQIIIIFLADERMLLHSEIVGRCQPIDLREITKEELKMVNSSDHVKAVEMTSVMFSCYFTPDTYANEDSARAAKITAGLCADLATTILSGRVKNGFALVRPPGHHAGIQRAMGFCLHNNAAVAALAAQAARAKKVLVVDWVLYISLHRHDGGKVYTGTGSFYENVVLPIASAFAPDFTIISAGFDAARGDPLGCCDVTPTGYAKMTQMLSSLSGGKLLVLLEGGYNLRSISSSAVAVIQFNASICSGVEKK